MLFIKTVAYLLAGSYVFMLIYFILRWVKELVYVPSGIRWVTRASVIIPVRNESQTIGKVLNDISLQDYPGELFEIIVVDDNSDDDTIEKAIQLQTAMPNLRVIKAMNNGSGKKNAILTGITQSRGDLVITTDADCSMDKQWLSTLVSFFEQYQPEMIIAPVIFHKEKSFFDKIQSLEFLSLSLITGASALAGYPLMCNGANLAYRKDSFFAVNGFEGNEQTPSGDDILLMIKFMIKFRGKVKYIKSKNAAVCTSPQKTIPEFINQRKRWISKTPHYRDFLMGASSWLVFTFIFSILVFIPLSFMNKGFAEILAVSFSAKFFIDFLFLFLAASFFDRKSLLWLYLPVQMMYVFYVPVITFAGLAGRFSWKGRNY